MIHRSQTPHIAEAVASPEKALLKFCDDHGVVPYHPYRAEHPNHIGYTKVWGATSPMDAIMSGAVNIELTYLRSNIAVPRHYVYVDLWEILLFAPPPKQSSMSNRITPYTRRPIKPLELWHIFGALYTWPQVATS